jgi:hypothetical protein
MSRPCEYESNEPSYHVANRGSMGAETRVDHENNGLTTWEEDLRSDPTPRGIERLLGAF